MLDRSILACGIPRLNQNDQTGASIRIQLILQLLDLKLVGGRSGNDFLFLFLLRTRLTGNIPKVKCFFSIVFIGLEHNRPFFLVSV